MKMPNILLEGPDASGKSTVAKALVERGYTYFHMGSDAPSPDIYLPELEALSNSGTSIVMDRDYLSTLIYEQTFNNRLPADVVSNLTRFFKLYDTLILCLPPREAYFKNFEKCKQERDEEYSDMAAIYDCYESIALSNFYRCSHRICLLHDFTRDSDLSRLMRTLESVDVLPNS